MTGRLWRAAWLAVLAPAAAWATVTCPSVFSDGMVLQRGCKVPIWGHAETGETVTVQFQGQAVSTTAKAGAWQVELAPLHTNGADNLVIAGDRNTLILRNVLVGDVWLCSGQSNMAYALQLCDNGPEVARDAVNPNVRLLSVPHRYAGRPQGDAPLRWEESSPPAAAAFSGVGFLFGRSLFHVYQVPIGLIDSSYGGTPIEAWMSARALKAANLPEVLSLYARSVHGFADAVQRTEAEQAAWRRQVAQAEADHRVPPPPPEEEAKRLPTALYNAMIAPLVPFALRGVLWYQGESNVDHPEQYRPLFQALIRDWRAAWGEPKLPFLFVQLPGYEAPNAAPDAWAKLREAQWLTSLAEPATAMVVTYDLGETDNLHPRRKEPVAARLVRAARAVAYGEQVPFRGPTYQSMTMQGQKLKLQFANTDGGLVAWGGPLQGFTIAGADGRFVPAMTELEGDSVWVWSPRVQQPMAVRYAWANVPTANLFNGIGLPASPFRTDDFALTNG